MFGWLREFLEIKADYRERKKDTVNCQSCETLKMQLSIANEEKKQLLNRLLEKPEKEVVQEVTGLKPVLPRTHLSFNARRQALEAEDRVKARNLKQRIEEINEINSEAGKQDLAELEKELDIAGAEREAKVANS